jgi:hypothetical protein
MTGPAAPDTVVDVAAAMVALGAAYRGDWSDFDGRTLRAQLDELSDVLRDGTWHAGRPFHLQAWAAVTGLCIPCGAWTEHCTCTPGGDPCPYPTL